MPDAWAYQDDADEFDRTEHLPSSGAVVRRRRSGPKSLLAVRLDGEDIERLRQRAEELGVGVTQLARAWLLERLDEPPEGATVDDLVTSLQNSLKAARAMKRTGNRRAS